MSWPRRVIGIGLVTVAAVVVMGALLALIDPSIKLSDDGDPFGPAPLVASTLISLAAGFLLAAAGLWLTLASRRPIDAGDGAGARAIRICITAAVSVTVCPAPDSAWATAGTSRHQGGEC